MKKIIYTFIFLLPLLLFACSNNESDLKMQLEIAEKKNQELKLEKEIQLVKEQNLILIQEANDIVKAKAEAIAFKEAQEKAEAIALKEAQEKAQIEAIALKQAQEKAQIEAQIEAQVKAKLKEAQVKAEAEAKLKEAQVKAEAEAEAKLKEAQAEAELKIAKEAQAEAQAELKIAKEAQAEAQAEIKKLKNTVDWEEITKNNLNKIVPIYLDNLSDPSGTGFIFKLNRNDNAAFAITNYHVVENNSIVQVKILNKLYSAEVLIENTKKDLAILRICCSSTNSIFESINLVPVTVELGSKIGILGFPMGSTSINITTGVISGKKTINDLLIFQTDSLVNPGNSGGPAINVNGNLVGVVTSKLPNTDKITSIANIVSIDEVLDFIYSIDSSVYNTKTNNKSSDLSLSKPASLTVMSKSKDSPTIEQINVASYQAGKTYEHSPDTEITFEFPNYNYLSDGSRFKWSHGIAFEGTLINGTWAQYYHVQIDFDGYASWGWKDKTSGETRIGEQKFLSTGSFNTAGNNKFKIFVVDDKGFFFFNDKLVFNINLNKYVTDTNITTPHTWVYICPPSNTVACQKGISEIGNVPVSIYEKQLYVSSTCDKSNWEIINRVSPYCRLANRKSTGTLIMQGTLDVGNLFYENQNSPVALYNYVIWLNRRIPRTWDINYPGDVITFFPEGNYIIRKYDGTFKSLKSGNNYTSWLQKEQTINLIIIDNKVHIFLENETKSTVENYIQTITLIPDSAYSTYVEFIFTAELRNSSKGVDTTSITKLTNLKYFASN